MVSLILVATIVLLVSEKVSVDLIAIGIMVALMLSGVLAPDEAVAGFANPAPLTVGALFMVSKGLMRTGSLDIVSERIGDLSRGGRHRLLLISILVAGVFSAFINNTPVVVLFISIVMAVCARYELAPSKFLMPISFASILAGTSTLIGTSTNIIVSDIASGMGHAEIGMFELSVVGVPIAIAGGLFLFLFSFKILPEHKAPIFGPGSDQDHLYISELVVPAGSELEGINPVDGLGERFPDVEVYEVTSGWYTCDPTTDRCEINQGDVVLVKSSVNDLAQMLEEGLVMLQEGEGGKVAKPYESQSLLVELIIPPNSNLIGRKLTNVRLSADPDIHILGVKRRRVHYTEQKKKNLRLAVGDVLLIQAPLDHIEEMRASSDYIVVEEVFQTLVKRTRAPIAIGIFLVMIAAVTAGFFDILEASLAAAFLMMITGCLSLRQAYKSVDVQVLLLIIGTIALGSALSKTGAADIYAEYFLLPFRGASPQIVLAGFIALTSILTHLISNNSTAVLLVPIALSTASTLGVDPRAFIVGICFGASACYASPIGYQTNLLVYGPGGYKFSDFIKLGMPLNIIVWIMASLLVPVFWPL